MSDTDFQEKAAIAFQRLTPKAGDLIVVTVPEELSESGMKSAADFLGKLARDYNVSIVINNDGTSLELYTEEVMKEIGWIRDPDFVNRDISPTRH